MITITTHKKIEEAKEKSYDTGHSVGHTCGYRDGKEKMREWLIDALATVRRVKGLNISLVKKEDISTHGEMRDMLLVEVDMSNGLRLPKESSVIVVVHKGINKLNDKEEIIAINGRWKRMPMDGEILIFYNKNNHERFKDL